MELIRINEFRKEESRDIYTTKITVQSLSRIFDCVIRLSFTAYYSICNEYDVYNFFHRDGVLDIVFEPNGKDELYIDNYQIISLNDDKIQKIMRKINLQKI